LTHSVVILQPAFSGFCVTYILISFDSIKRHRSIVWSMTVWWMLAEPSFRRRLNSSTSHTEFS